MLSAAAAIVGLVVGRTCGDAVVLVSSGLGGFFRCGCALCVCQSCGVVWCGQGQGSGKDV